MMQWATGQHGKSPWVEVYMCFGVQHEEHSEECRLLFLATTAVYAVRSPSIVAAKQFAV